MRRELRPIGAREPAARRPTPTARARAHLAVEARDLLECDDVVARATLELREVVVGQDRAGDRAELWVREDDLRDIFENVREQLAIATTEIEHGSAGRTPTFVEKMRDSKSGHSSWRSCLSICVSHSDVTTKTDVVSDWTRFATLSEPNVPPEWETMITIVFERSHESSESCNKERGERREQGGGCAGRDGSRPTDPVGEGGGE